MNRFVVGSGRCGSTLMGNMLGRHPDVLELSEFFAALDRREVWSRKVVPGQHFAQFLATPDVPLEVMTRRNLIPREVLHAAADGQAVPPLLIATLPGYSEDPASLFRELYEAVCEFPEQSFPAHYDMLFTWLTGRLGKTVWIERSGQSIEYLPELVDLYPDARYVYLHRDGAATALSMQNHAAFQFYVATHFGHLTREELMATEYGGHPISQDDPISRMLSAEATPIGHYAEFWSFQQIQGFRGLAKLRPDQYTLVAFEDLVADPAGTLRDIAEFLDLPDRPGWVEAAAAMVTGAPPSRAPHLSTEDLEAVRRGCEVGELLLGRHEVPWFNPTFRRIRELESVTSVAREPSSGA